MYSNFIAPKGDRRRNEPQPEKLFRCEVTVTLVRNENIATRDYETDEEFGGDYTSLVDWDTEWRSQHLGVVDVLEGLSKAAVRLLPSLNGKQRADLEELIQEAKGWTEYEIYVERSNGADSGTEL